MTQVFAPNSHLDRGYMPILSLRTPRLSVQFGRLFFKRRGGEAGEAGEGVR